MTRNKADAKIVAMYKSSLVQRTVIIQCLKASKKRKENSNQCIKKVLFRNSNNMMQASLGYRAYY